MTSENRTITIVVSPKGWTKVETHGYFESSCREASKFIEEALGQRTAEQLTSAFYQTNHHHEQEVNQ